MTNQKNQNSIPFLTTLGVLFLVAGAFAQPPEGKPEQDKQGVYINKRPMTDFGDQAASQIETGKIKLEAPFRVVVSGKLAVKGDGKTVGLTNAKVESSTQPEDSDPAMVKLVQEGIMAVSDAGWFGYLEPLSVKNVIITVEQTGDTFSVDIHADQPSETDARRTSSALQSLLSVGSIVNKDPDTKTLLAQTGTTSEGKQVIISFKLPKAQFQELIKRKIAESKTAKTKVSGDQ